MDKFVMVPVEPTTAMAIAAISASLKWPSCLNGTVQYQAMLGAAPAPTIDEVEERAAFEDWANAQWPGAQRQQLELGEGGRYKNPIYRDMLVGWLACARSKAGVL